MYNNQINTKKKRNDIPTPECVCEFLYDIIIEHYNPKCILDNSAGDGRLTKRFVNASTISYEIKEGKDFLEETEEIDCDFVLFNPPFNTGGSKKLICERFLEHTFKLIKDKNIPVMMFAPMGFRLNQHCYSKRWKKLRDNYPDITTIISLPLDIYTGIDFHNEIVCWNTDKLKAHYFLPESYIHTL
jgi:hypothetical protein